jgi:hypothetical protein
MSRFQDLLGDDLVFEVPIEIKHDHYTIWGSIDCIDLNNKIVYEFKCKHDISNINLMQLALYKLGLHKNKKYAGYNYRIVSILTGQVLEIDADHKKLCQMLECLLHSKNKAAEDESDDDWILKCSSLDL